MIEGTWYVAVGSNEILEIRRRIHLPEVTDSNQIFCDFTVNIKET